SCMQKTPEAFDTYVDTEIAWADVSQTSGPQSYPQEGSLLFLVKIENPDGLTSWVGLWSTIRRQSYREFMFFDNELSGMNVYAESANLVGPIAYYIQNFQSIPFRWLTRASFGDALSISAVGGDDADLDSSPPVLQSVEPPGNDIDVINKENYFVFPRTSSGYGFPITLEKNPDFECGDGYCESSLGENSDTCCFDCKCSSGQYCDAIPSSPELGTCKEQGLLDFTVVGTPSAEVSDCSHSFEVGITARFSNVPASMKEGVTGVIKVEGSTYPAQCTGDAGLYDCRFTMSPTISCGSVTKQLGPNELKLTVTYMDGINSITTDLTEEFPAISLDYDCSCPDGKYCDTGQETCETISGVTLSIIELNSYMEDYDVGDPIRLKAKISNPPTGTKLLSTSTNFSLSEGKVFPGTPVCTGPAVDNDGGFVYDCMIPFNIEPYAESKNYKFFPNFLEFDIDFNDGPDKRTMTLSKVFGPISIPSQNCGNGVQNVGETSENCCQDAGCGDFGESYYCDVTRGCMDIDDVTLSAVAYPVELEDCKSPNEVNIKVTVENPPYGIRLDSKSLTIN
ncbi:MAG: hypothetical protein KAT35_02855, partial [Candidatus Aenigmarchaeota archaeon]|nr:hypothetical protein [Candidatus Aenigmarchaeota archaeon]